MIQTKYTATFKFILEGVGLASPTNESRQGRTIELGVSDAATCEFSAKIVVDNVTRPEGEASARLIVDALYEQILERLADHVEHAVPPSLRWFEYQGDAATSVARGISVGSSAVIGIGCAVLAPNLFLPCLNSAIDAPLQTSTGPAMVQAARRMYRVAVETSDAVASFLICYSALLLGALHRGNRGQRQVDLLLLGVDPNIVQTAHLDASGRTRHETLYTEIRNRFVHAEERGNDPALASSDMRINLRTFRSIAARALATL